jgi:hypothetical protein
MIQRISEPVSVIAGYNATTKAVRPISLEWSRRTYPVLQVGLRHTYREGITRHHVFSVVSNHLFFRLNLNADNLSWTLEEVSDGLPD